MAGAIEKFVIDSGGARALLRSPGVRAMLLARALRVAAAADAQLATLDAPYPAVEADSYTGAGRAGATVLGVPLPLERSRRILGGAIDAAG
jgi:hypothetical protein